ncbi:MAG: hypothetical protein HKN91_04170 [Acidimicrobiia bacterium]|nr:hypothetical protein [Acidimicrobiia bacterium]
MGDVVRKFVVMLASPSDIRGRMEVVCASIRQWNRTSGQDRRVVVEPWMWERDAASEVTQRCGIQYVVFQYLNGSSYFCFAFFWTRLGQPTHSYPSGTVAEIEHHFATGKPVGVFLSREPTSPSLDPQKIAQTARLATYLEDSENRILPKEFGTDEELTTLIHQQLSLVTEQMIAALDDTAGTSKHRTTLASEEQLEIEIMDIDDMAKRIKILNGIECAVCVNVEVTMPDVDPVDRALVVGGRDIEIPGLSESFVNVYAFPPASWDQLLRVRWRSLDQRFGDIRDLKLSNPPST